MNQRREIDTIDRSKVGIGKRDVTHRIELFIKRCDYVTTVNILYSIIVPNAYMRPICV